MVFLHVCKNEKEARTSVLVTNTTCTVCMVRAINATDTDQPGKAQLREQHMSEHDEHCRKMRKWMNIYKMLNAICQMSYEHLQTLHNTVQLNPSRL